MKTTSSRNTDAKRAESSDSKPAAPSERAGHEDRQSFSRGTASPTPEYDGRKAGSARGQPESGGASKEKPSTEGTHSDQRHARERYGEQSGEQRQDSKAKEGQQNLGGQDSRDQSTGDRFSLQGRAGGTAGEARDQEIEPQQRRSAGAADSSDVRGAQDTLSEQGRREEQRRSAPGGAGYDTNWTREDKGVQPGPAAADSKKKRSSGT